MSHERMPCRWSGQDLNGRLSGSIVRYEGVPVLVSIDKTMEKLRLVDLVQHNDIKTISPNDPGLDVSSPEVGYMGWTFGDKRIVMYVSRPPHRQWKQGLRHEVLRVQKIDGEDIQGYMGNWTYSEDFRQMIMKVYPPLDVAMKLLEKQKEVAISQEVAIQKTEAGVLLVYFRTKNVGYVEPGSRTVKVQSSSFGWIVSKFLSEFNWKVE